MNTNILNHKGKMRMDKGIPKGPPHQEEIIEYLYGMALKPALLVKVRSIFPGMGAQFGLREFGDERISMFTSQKDAHKHWKKEWLVSGITIKSRELEDMQIELTLDRLDDEAKAESLTAKDEMNYGW